MLDDLNSPSTIHMDGLWTASPFLTSEWVICGSALSSQEKVLNSYLLSNYNFNRLLHDLVVSKM